MSDDLDADKRNALARIMRTQGDDPAGAPPRSANAPCRLLTCWPPDREAAAVVGADAAAQSGQDASQTGSIATAARIRHAIHTAVEALGIEQQQPLQGASAVPCAAADARLAVDHRGCAAVRCDAAAAVDRAGADDGTQDDRRQPEGDARAERVGGVAGVLDELARRAGIPGPGRLPQGPSYLQTLLATATADLRRATIWRLPGRAGASRQVPVAGASRKAPGLRGTKRRAPPRRCAR